MVDDFPYSSELLTFIKHWLLGSSCHIGTHQLGSCADLLELENTQTNATYLNLFLYLLYFVLLLPSSDSCLIVRDLLSDDQRPQSHKAHVSTVHPVH